MLETKLAQDLDSQRYKTPNYAVRHLASLYNRHTLEINNSKSLASGSKFKPFIHTEFIPVNFQNDDDFCNLILSDLADTLQEQQSWATATIKKIQENYPDAELRIACTPVRRALASALNLQNAYNPEGKITILNSLSIDPSCPVTWDIYTPKITIEDFKDSYWQPLIDMEGLLTAQFTEYYFLGFRKITFEACGMYKIDPNKANFDDTFKIASPAVSTEWQSIFNIVSSDNFNDTFKLSEKNAKLRALEILKHMSILDYAERDQNFIKRVQALERAKTVARQVRIAKSERSAELKPKIYIVIGHSQNLMSLVDEASVNNGEIVELP